MAEYINSFTADLTSIHTIHLGLKLEMSTKLSSETRYNLLILISATNMTIATAVRGVKSRPLQTGLLSFGVLSWLLTPEIYFGLVKHRPAPRKVNYHFIERD